jgi:uncharacterized OB-fold protein
MQEFLGFIRKGEFRIYVCNSCKRKIWPPFQYCPKCLSKADLKKIERKGVLLEFAFSHLKGIEGVFGIVDISGIRLMGSIFGQPLRHGMKVTLVKCGINPDGSIFYHFKKRSNEEV